MSDNRYLEIKVGQAFQCEDFHVWLFCKSSPRTEDGPIYYSFVRPDTADHSIWTYGATNIDTLCRRFPILNEYVREREPKVIKKFKIKIHRIQTNDWDEQVIEAVDQDAAEEEARDWWFDNNEQSYIVEEV